MLLGPRNSYIYNISNIMCFHRGFNVNLSNEGTWHFLPVSLLRNGGILWILADIANLVYHGILRGTTMSCHLLPM